MFQQGKQSNRTLLSALVEVAQNTIVLFFQTPSHMMQILWHLFTSMLACVAVRLDHELYTPSVDVLESDSHLSPASAAVLLLRTDGRSQSEIFPQMNLCIP